MLNLPIEQIDKSVIEKLIEDGIPESKTLEYKRDLPGTEAGHKKEFLADVTSFANASGGDIIYGIEELITEDNKKTGKPAGVYGISGEEPDGAIRRLHAIINSGVDPRFTPGVQIKPIEDFENGKKVLLLRIPRSWSAPHMVKTQNSRFYTRNSAGKQPLDAREIRMAFALSEELPRRMQQFRNERLAMILSNEGPMPIRDSAKLIIHVVPISAMDSSANVEISKISQATERFKLFGYTGESQRFNLDGCLIYTNEGRTPDRRAYIQFFRNGIIEAINTEAPMAIQFDQKTYGNITFINGIEIGNAVIRILEQTKHYYQRIAMQPPVFVFVSLSDVGHSIILGSGQIPEAIMPYKDNYIINNDVLMLPDVQLDDLESDVGSSIKPALDALWQASGHAFCTNYNENNKWQG